MAKKQPKSVAPLPAMANVIGDSMRWRRRIALLLALSRGEFALTSIRNADLRALLYPSVKTSKTSKAETRRTSAAITRQFSLMRAHGLLRKLSSTHRYQLTAKGRRIITALIAACNAAVDQRTKIAA